MENTNHNLWTLTKHLAHSVNNTAAKIDISIYGGKTNVVAVVPPKPVQRPTDPSAPSGSSLLVGIAIFVAFVGIILLRKYYKH